MDRILKPRRITFVFTIILIPLIFVPLNFLVDPVCSKVTSTIFFSTICINIFSFLANTSSWLLLLITAIIAYIVSTIYVNLKSKNKNFRTNTATDIIFAFAILVLAGILFLMGISSLATFGEKNEAKVFIIPVESYAHSQGWKSVQVVDGVPAGENPTPYFSEVFLTKQTPYEIAPNMLNLIRNEGFVNGSVITSEMIQTTIKNHNDLDLGGLDANGNKMSVTISTKEFAREDNSTIKVSSGMTAVIVTTVYEKQSH